MTGEHTRAFAPQFTVQSGPGSTAAFSAPYRTWLETFLMWDDKIASIVDLGCGDMEIMSRVNLHGADYLGIDCIDERICRNRVQHPHMKFEIGEFHTMEIPECDLILCKDVLQHWKTADILAWLEQLRAHRDRFRYALLTNCNYLTDAVNADILTGRWRPLDLTKPPFSIGHVAFSWGSPNKDVVLVDGA